MVGRCYGRRDKLGRGIGQVGEVGGTSSRGSSHHNPSQLLLVPSQPAAGPRGLGVRLGWDARNRGWQWLRPDSLFPVGWCDPLNPNGSWRSPGRAVLPASCTQWPWDCPAIPRDTPGISPPALHGAEGDIEARGKCGGIGKALGAGGWGSGCGKKAVEDKILTSGPAAMLGDGAGCLWMLLP